jgi:hypothetical protein
LLGSADFSTKNFMRLTVRSLAAEAKLSVQACRECLRDAGLGVAVGGQRLQGNELARARAVLGLPKHRTREQTATFRPPIDESEMIVRLLRPLRQKGKLGRLHTTPFEHVYGHGVPDHLKAEAKARAEELVVEGCLAEKVSQGRRHVWLTEHGLRRLGEAERGAQA